MSICRRGVVEDVVKELSTPESIMKLVSKIRNMSIIPYIILLETFIKEISDPSLLRYLNLFPHIPFLAPSFPFLLSRFSFGQ